MISLTLHAPTGIPTGIPTGRGRHLSRPATGLTAIGLLSANRSGQNEEGEDMTRHDHKNQHDHKNEDPEKDPYEKDPYKNNSHPGDEYRTRKPVRILGMEIEPAQFWIISLLLLPLALLYRFGVFESAGLNSIQTVAIFTPLVVMALVLAFTHHNGHYLHMALTEKLRQRKLASPKRQRPVNQTGNQTGNHREDEGV